MLCVLVGVWALSVVSAQAAVTHSYLSQVTEVPAGGGVAVPGPVTALDALTVDAGHLWVAEHIEGTGGSRIDEFDAGSGVFLSQFPQPAGLRVTAFGVAVGHATGEGVVYVGAVDTGLEHQGRVGVFSEAGVLLGAWTGADTPTGPFGSGAVVGVAVDGSLGGPASGDVYVLDNPVEGSRVVDVFKPEAGGKEPLAGNVSQLTGTCPVAGTVCEPAEVVPFTDPSRIAVASSTGDVLVMDTAEGHGVIDVFEPQLLGGYLFVRQIPVPPVSGFSSLGLAVDGGTGEIYVAVGSSPGFVDQFSSVGVFLGRIVGSDTPAGDLKEPSSVAVDPASHRVFVGDKRELPEPGVLPQSSVLDVFGPDLVIPDVITGVATNVKPRSATLTGTVKLDKEGEASCRFVWGTTPEFGRVAPCSALVSAEESAVQANIGLGAGNELEPDTTYYYRLQATNKNGTNPSEPSADQQFRTTGPGIHGESASNVAATSATLNATIDPNNASTTYFFQYGTSSAYGTDVPAPPGLLLGSGVGDVATSPLHVQGLTAGTVYHFRVVAVSELEPGVFTTFGGQDRTFTTQAPGGFVLPDGRAWEMVSPPDKRGALIEPISAIGLVQASVNGNAVSFVADIPTEAEPSGYTNGLNVFAWRGADGWVSQDHTTPHRVATGSPGAVYEARFYSEDLSLEALNTFGPFEPSLSNEASEQTAFVRTDYLHGSVNEPCTKACYMPFVTGKSGFANVPSGTVFGSDYKGESCPPGVECGPTFINSTPDLKHVLLESSVALTSTSLSAQGSGGLYEWSGGKLTPVSVLPGSSVVGPGEGVSIRRPMSDDGSRIVWGVNGHLYLRDTVKGETLQLDAVQGGPGGGQTIARARLQSFSTDGSKVFFMDIQQLTADSGGPLITSEESDDLYECEIMETAGKLTCDLSDLTPPAAKERAYVQSEIVGASNDGSYVYFVANGVFAPGAVPGTCRASNHTAGAVCNLYVRHDGKTGLVAVLSGADEADFNAFENLARTKVSADGRWLVFMSQRELTGYNTYDAITGKPDEEVYLYNAVSGRLVCASCNPTGARPIGKEDRNIKLAIGGDPRTWDPERGLAANVPGWTSYGANGHTLYQSRYLNDSGRVFFNSSDGLVPQDVNGQEDVYQYEPPGVGDCTTASPTFSERSGGCISLISAGTSPEESAFLDASGTGSDVFFLTASKLASQDFDTSLDVYDAHECEATGSCFAPVPAQPPACSTGDACKPSASVQPSLFGAPSSATFSGAGNISQSGSGTLVRSKSLTRAQKLARALRACHLGKKGGKRRRVCERQARARYAAKRSKTGTKIGRG